MTDEEKAQLSAETVKKLQDSMARVEELKKRHEAGVQNWIALVNTFAGKGTAENAPTLFAGCPIVCEAFDEPDQKALLVETLFATCPDTTIVSGSGMAGMGSANTIRTRKALERLYLCGDGCTDVATEGSLASPRVSVCAGHQANMVLRLILGETEP